MRFSDSFTALFGRETADSVLSSLADPSGADMADSYEFVSAFSSFTA